MSELKMLEKMDPEDRKKKITDLWAYTSQILDGVRRLTLELRPSDLDELGLIPALRSYTNEYIKKFNINIDFQVKGFRGRLPSDMEVALYRVVQEALTNVVKHSGATSVLISMRRGDDLVMVTIKDNGHGFNMDEVKLAGGRFRLPTVMPSTFPFPMNTLIASASLLLSAT